MTPIKRSLCGIGMSLVEVIIGILLLINPVGFTSGIIVTFGIVLMIMGISTTLKYFWTDAVEASVRQLLVKGLLLLLSGAFCTFCSRWFLVTFPILTLIYGVVILVAGITKLQWTIDMIRMKRSRWFFVAISAAASVLCGIVIVSNPFASTAAVWMFIGISLIVEAAFDMLGSIFGDRDRKPDEIYETEET